MDCNIQCCALVIFVAVAATFVASKGTGCLGFNDEVDPWGNTYPHGDIILQYGQPLQIFCVLQPTSSFNSSVLTFTRNSVDVPKDTITIVNRTTIRLFIEKLEPVDDSLYICKVKTDTYEKAVCMNRVAVGLPPQEVKNFTCVSQNWDNLNCSWVPPNNFVKTTYNLSYYLPSGRVEYLCPNRTENEKNSCVWDKSTSPIYRQAYDTYKLILRASNIFKNVTWKYKIQHYASVIPNKAENLTLINSTHNSLTIEWVIPTGLENFSPGLIYEVKYSTLYHDWKEVDTSKLCVNKCPKRYELTLTGLYAHTLYDIRVRCRSSKGVLWSEYATITPMTKPFIPGGPPKTDIGSFEIKQTWLHSLLKRDIFVYWQELSKIEENGENFEYKIINVEENGYGINITPSEVTKWYARFKGLSNNTFRFEIKSSNSEGLSLTSSQVTVPSSYNLPAEPESVTKIPYQNGTYELSWRPPINKTAVTSYTIFWCENKSDRSHCSGVLNWTRVGKDVFMKNISLPPEGLYQFAVSANSEYVSSGMVWASCTILPDRAGGKMKSVNKSIVGPTYIDIDWKLDCSDQIGVVLGFRVFYCLIPKISCTNQYCTEIQTCKEPPQFKEINDSRATHGRIEGLKPYSSYKLNVTVITKNWVGIESDALFFTTLETSPEVVESLSVTQITNTSISLKWAPPSSMNGVLRNYIVYWNGSEDKVEEGRNITLMGLKSFEKYYISVSACTITCGPRSKPILVTTLVGRPSEIEEPKVRFYNSSELVVSWSPPSSPAGNVSYYNVRFKLLDGAKVIRENISVTKSLQARIPATDCLSKGPNLLFKVSVRAVNLGDDNSTMEGPWSPDGEGNCFHSHFSAGLGFIILISVIGILSLLVFCLFCGWFSRWVWLKCKRMQDVQIKLPARLGLGPRADIDKSEDNHSMHAWVNQSKEIDKIHHVPSPDEQCLLEDKKDKEDIMDYFVEEYDKNDESSGCSSGKESVSSGGSGTHRDSNDSGTEADTTSGQPVLAKSCDGPAYVTVPPPIAVAHRGYVTMPPFAPQQAVAKGYMMATAATSPLNPLPSSTPYCILGLKQVDLPKSFSSFTDHLADEIVSPLNSN